MKKGYVKEKINHRSEKLMSIGLLMVYGTLRPGKDKAVTLKGFKMYNLGWFPGVIQTNEVDDTIVCEAVPVRDEEHLARLDAYEGCHGNTSSCLYHRVNLYEGQEALDPVWIYVYNGNPAEDKRIQSGDWLEHSGDGEGSNTRLVEEEEGVAG